MSRHLLQLASLVTLCATATGLAEPVGLDDVPRLTVRGEAVLHKPADQLRVRVGVVTQAAEATAAVKENSRRMADVIAAIKKAGVDKSEYETSRFSIRPLYSRRPRQANAEWVRQIIGYEVNNTLAIRTKKLALAGKLIEVANDAGVNSVDDIRFDLADPRTHRAEAIAAATANARSDAAVLSRAAEVRLVRIISIQLGDSGYRTPMPTRARAEGMAAAVATPPPIQPGDVTVQASVTIIYEIAPSE